MAVLGLGFVHPEGHRPSCCVVKGPTLPVIELKLQAKTAAGQRAWGVVRGTSAKNGWAAGESALDLLKKAQAALRGIF